MRGIARTVDRRGCPRPGQAISPMPSCIRTRAAVHRLLARKADVNAPQADGTTALHWAARWDDLETAGLLIRAGAQCRHSEPRWRHADVSRVAERKRGDDRAAAQGRSERQRAGALARRDRADDGVAQRQCGRCQGPARSRSADQRKRHIARNHRADVGRRTGPCRQWWSYSSAAAPTCALSPRYCGRSREEGWGLLRPTSKVVPMLPSKAA